MIIQASYIKHVHNHGLIQDFQLHVCKIFL